MSTNVLRIIPCDPSYVPPARDRKEATAVLRRLLPRAEDIQAIVHDRISFVDAGDNFEAVRCPACKRELDMDWWQKAMGTAGANDFADLNVEVPCCGAKTSLNDLDYHWPAGFARFTLEASEPQLADVLDTQAVAQLETLLGTRVRQVRAHY
jgi:hypothetical protein